MDRRTTRVDRGTLATGILGLLVALLGITANLISGGFDLPAPDAPGGEMAAFADRHATGLAWDVALRFVILFLLFIPFTLGMARQVRGDGELDSFLARIPPLAAIWLAAAGGSANTLEAIVVFDHERLAATPDIARLLYLLIGAFYLLTLPPHAAVIGSLSAAAHRSHALPSWLCAGGYAIAALSFMAVLMMTRSAGYLDSSGPGLVASIAFAGTGLWYLLASLLLVAAWLRAHARAPRLEPAT
jgi:hypothetical protein